MNTRKSTKYGFHVYEDIEGEAIRRTSCLCWRCARMATPKQAEAAVSTSPIGETISDTRERIASAFNCPVAEELYRLCQRTGIAEPITRCPMFVETPPATGEVVDG